MDRQIRKKNAIFNVPEYQTQLSGRMSDMFSDNRGENPVENRMMLQAVAIDNWITKYNISNEAYEELTKILNDDF